MKYFFICYLLFYALAGSLFAGVDIKLADGTTYNNAEVRSLESGDLLLMHKGGIARIPVEQLTPENRALLELKSSPDIAKIDFATLVKSLKESAAIIQQGYRDGLQKLEENNITAGEVDAVVEIRSELAALPELKPESEIRFHGLREFRKEHVFRSVAEQSELAARLKEGLNDYRKSLQSFADDLDKSGRMVASAALKSEIDKIAAMAADPTTALVTLEIVPVIVKPAKPVLAASDYPSGRIIILPLTEAAQDASLPRTFSAVEKEDRRDIIGIGRSMFPNVGAIEADGNLVYWSNDEPTSRIVPGANMKCIQFHGLPLIGLDRDGSLNYTNNADEKILSGLAAQSKIIDMAATYGGIAFVSSDSRVSVVGPQSDHAHASLLRAMENVRSVGFSGFGFVTVLRRDGTVVKMRDGEVTTLTGIDPIAKLSYDGIGETKTGTLVNLGATPQAFINEVGPNPRQTFRENKLFCAIAEKGRFICQMKAADGELYPMKDVETALQGVLEFAPINGPNGAVWLAAILPANEVGRSGLWKVEELISARR